MFLQLNDIFLIAKMSTKTESNQILSIKNEALGRDFEIFKLSKTKTEQVVKKSSHLELVEQ